MNLTTDEIIYLKVLINHVLSLILIGTKPFGLGPWQVKLSKHD